MKPDELEKAKQDSRAFWDTMASSWERFGDKIREQNRPVDDWLIEHLAPEHGETILELAAGSGDTGFRAARAVGPSGRLLSTDLSGEMQAVAQRRAKEVGVENVEFRWLDAERMDLADDAVNGIICRYAYMLMLEPDRAFAEARRVLRPGGRLVLAVWTGGDDNPWTTVVRDALESRIELPAVDRNAPGGMFSLADPDRLRARLAGARLEARALEAVGIEMPHASFDELWEYYMDFYPFVAAAVAALPDQTRADLRADIRGGLSPFTHGESILLPGRAWCALATA